MKSIGSRYTLLVAVFAAILVFCGYMPAYADCISVCLAKHDCDTDFSHGAHAIGPDCLIYQNECKAQCGGGITVSFGAIAYDEKKHAWGLSDPQPNKEKAKKSALDFCGKYGSNCKVVETLSNACAAIAGGNDNVVTWAKAANSPDAQRTARRACVKETEDSCTVLRWQCYFPQ